MGNWDEYQGVDRTLFELEDMARASAEQERRKNTLEVCKVAVMNAYDAYGEGDIDRTQLKTLLKNISQRLFDNPTSTKDDAIALLDFIKTYDRDFSKERVIANKKKEEFAKLEDEIDKL